MSYRITCKPAFLGGYIYQINGGAWLSYDQAHAALIAAGVSNAAARNSLTVPEGI
jgi:hypothetical protein